MIKYQILGIIVAVAMMVNFLIKLDLNEPEHIEADNAETIPLKLAPVKQLKLAKSKNPVLPKNILSEKTEITKSELDNSNFANIPTDSNNNPVSSPGRSMGTNVSTASQAPLNRINLPFEEGKRNVSATARVDEKKQLINSTFRTIFKKDEKITAKPVPVVETIITSSSGGGGGSLAPNTCDANITGGSFNGPVGVQLSCSTNSTIKYCLAVDTGSGCCDPHVGGLTYSSTIVVGAQNGNFCLSFYGESNQAGDSVDYENSYIVNSSLPHLQVAHPQIYYQTTQLVGKSIINSSDFGRVGFAIGQINSGMQDPSPSALNLDCDQIINNTTFLTAPVPISVLALLDVSLDNPTIQIEIPLRYEHLEYGDNFITSFIADNNFVAPIYACSTAKVVLFDFDFFPEELIFGDIGDSTVREFTGGFSAYGFFEDESTFSLTRAPAGVNSEDNSGQKLQSGMFGIFY